MTVQQCQPKDPNSVMEARLTRAAIAGRVDWGVLILKSCSGLAAHYIEFPKNHTAWFIICTHSDKRCEKYRLALQRIFCAKQKVRRIEASVE